MKTTSSTSHPQPVAPSATGSSSRPVPTALAAPAAWQPSMGLVQPGQPVFWLLHRLLEFGRPASYCQASLV